MKRSLSILVLLLLLIVPTLAQEDTIESWTCPEGFEGQTLNVYNWSTYIADNTIPDFERACGVEVNYRLFDSDEEVLDIVQRGNGPSYDIAVPSGSIVSELLADDLLIPLDKEMIPNLANISPDLLNPPFDENNTYSLPYQWGTIAVGYNTNVFEDGITSWEQVWEHDGSVAWLNDGRALLGIALLMLGYDPNTDNTNEIIEARNYLGNRGGDNLIIVPDSEGQTLLEDGVVDVVVEYSGDIIDLTYECECEDFAYTIPQEGGNIWVDNMVVPRGANNPELAFVFIDYILDPIVNAEISNFTAYGSPNQVSIDEQLIDDELLADPGIYPSDEVRAGLFFIRNVGADANNTYRQAWSELTSFYGRE